MDRKKGGAFFVSKKDGILRSTTTKKPVSLDELRELATAGGGVLEKIEVKEVVKVKTRRVRVPVEVVPDMVDVAIKAMPESIRSIVKTCRISSEMGEGIEEMVSRWQEFRSVETAILAGIAMQPKARQFFSDCLDEKWSGRAVPTGLQDEVIVGGGLHAAIYCAMRVRMGFAPPLVLEQEKRAGGVFAVSKRPSFFLNSRNRPGELSVPGERDGTLNYLPGSLLQPSDICSSEYITNEAMAWVIRLTLAMNARVIADCRVSEVGSFTRDYNRRVDGCRITSDRGKTIAKRVIYAQGLGKPNRYLDDKRLLDFEQFMALVDEPFPMRGMKRIAVLGIGDGAKTVIESLVGLGPQMGMSVAALDWPTKIDWYGVGGAMTCDLWQSNNRTRYSALAGSLPRPTVTGERTRIVPKDKIALEYVKPGYNCILINERPYDLVVDCTGITEEKAPGSPVWSYYEQGGRNIAYVKDQRFAVGPQIKVPVTSSEQTLLKGIAENTTSLFRYAGRTAQLAEVLG